MKKSDPQRYPAEVFWSDEDEGFIAIAPDLPGCSAWGASEADALSELRAAIDAWIEAAQTAGNPVPEPTLPANVEAYSGKFVLRLPRSLHATLARKAKTENVSLNQYVVFLLSTATANVRALSYEAAASCLLGRPIFSGVATISQPAVAYTRALVPGYTTAGIVSGCIQRMHTFNAANIIGEGYRG